jgi:hypothetical protein
VPSARHQCRYFGTTLSFESTPSGRVRARCAHIVTGSSSPIMITFVVALTEIVVKIEHYRSSILERSLGKVLWFSSLS